MVFRKGIQLFARDRGGGVRNFPAEGGLTLLPSPHIEPVVDSSHTLREDDELGGNCYRHAGYILEDLVKVLVSASYRTSCFQC